MTIYSGIPAFFKHIYNMNRETFEQVRETYYEFMRWDEETRNPAAPTLRRLSPGLDQVANNKEQFHSTKIFFKFKGTCLSQLRCFLCDGLDSILKLPR